MTDIWGKNEDLYIWEKGKSGGHAIAGIKDSVVEVERCWQTAWNAL